MKRKSWLIWNLAGIIYIGLLIYLLFFAFFRKGTETTVNLVPFKSIIGFCRDFYWPHWWYWAVNVPGNIVAFIPIPFILKSMFNPKFQRWNKFLIALFVPVGIELTQYVFQVGSCNIDDVILNFAGFYIGFWLVGKKKRERMDVKTRD